MTLLWMAVRSIGMHPKLFPAGHSDIQVIGIALQHCRVEMMRDSSDCLIYFTDRMCIRYDYWLFGTPSETID
jgi:hypothetical protein